MKTKVSIILVCLIWMASSMYATEGALRGKFAISATDTVAFSRGNLQYQPSTSTWRFAENQWNFVGTANGRIRHYQYSTEGWVWTYKGWLDLFGWGTGNNPTASTSTNSNYGSFTDWGRNAISNGGKKANLWRTMTKDEWDYLFRERENAASLYANGTVSGVNGSILLPDNWVIPADLHFKPSNSTDSTAAPNNYTADEWVLMEMAGAVFLPITYERSMDWQSEYCTAVYQENTARYWTSTPNGTNGAYYYIPLTPNVYQDNRYVGKGVRLVQNHEGGDLFPVVPNTNSAMFQWKSVPNAETYTLHVFSDSTRTEEVFYITFDRDGKVTGLHFIPHAPSRKSETDSTYTDRLFFYTLKGLQANTDYWYSISGEDANGQTLQTTEGTFKTAAIEAASDRVTVDPAQTSAVFMWPTDSAANTYQIDIYKDGATFCHLTLGPTGTLVGISFAPGKNAPSDTTVPSSLSFNVTGLDAASRYNYVLSTLDANGTPIHVYTGAFATTGYSGEKPVGDGQEVIPTPPVIPADPEASETPTGIEELSDEAGTFEGSNGKILRNGQLLIRRGKNCYTLTGQIVQ
ncbi:MAG: hypothetical protein IKP57_04885 [Paludibacteraceae bacterium]|nr:hypothetical protein [Paludibacteraceae bacterium]